MCGIAGLCNFMGDGQLNMERMKKRMILRGPNASGTWKSESGQVILGHQRLSIVDLSENGAQPMLSHSGRYVMTYNGEIYNYLDLADKLMKDGKISAFRGSSDTEVLLEAIEAYGIEDTLQRCKGMFAIGLYDREKGTITLARDRVGEKPLYYGFVNGAFVFASDIACFREIDGFHNPINTAVLGSYFTHGYIPAPDSIYENIWKLTPGCIMTVEAPYTPCGLMQMCARQKQYWSMMDTALYGQMHPFTGTEEEAADELERLLKQAIAGQMVADVPVGAFLSAGIDSSTIVSLMQNLAPGKVRTFTIGMEDPAYNEAQQAAEIARYLGTEHTEMYISEADAKAVIPKLTGMFGEPFADSSQIPTYLVSKMTRNHVTVSLSGDAGDELFCGYRSYESISRIWGKMEKVPLPIRKAAGAFILNSPLASDMVMRDKAHLLYAKGPVDVSRIQQTILDPVTQHIALQQSGMEECLPENYLKEVNHEMMLLDMLRYHPDDILTKVDRTGMAVSLETRIPLLDKDVIAYAWTLPIQYLRDERNGKKVLRNVLYRHVPRELVDRPKKGFSIPIKRWLLEPQMREWAENLMDTAQMKADGYLDPQTVRAIWDEYTKKGVWRPQIWYILMFQQWLKEAVNA
ncbi:MAG: asparagine synthase (glutamine-hydrolyzing) [Butyrivibrio sp.]|nr:asparagine synthase (glutamine-hydrolyzing) [Butyrivibrio sp.]